MRLLVLQTSCKAHATMSPRQQDKQTTKTEKKEDERYRRRERGWSSLTVRDSHFLHLAINLLLKETRKKPSFSEGVRFGLVFGGAPALGNAFVERDIDGGLMAPCREHNSLLYCFGAAREVERRKRELDA